MTSRTHVKRTLVRAVVGAIAAAAFAVPAALADPPQGHRAASTDALDRYIVNNVQSETRSPLRVPDALDRYVESRLPGIRGDQPDGYQPQVRGIEVPGGSNLSTDSDGFGWRDASLLGFALSLIAGGMLLVGTRGRRRMAHS